MSDGGGARCSTIVAGRFGRRGGRPGEKNCTEKLWRKPAGCRTTVLDVGRLSVRRARCRTISVFARLGLIIPTAAPANAISVTGVGCGGKASEYTCLRCGGGWRQAIRLGIAPCHGIRGVPDNPLPVLLATTNRSFESCQTTIIGTTTNDTVQFIISNCDIIVVIIIYYCKVRRGERHRRVNGV